MSYKSIIFSLLLAKFCIISCSAQESCTIIFSKKNFELQKISVFTYSPYLVESFTEHIRYDIDPGKIVIKCQKPEIIRFHNSIIIVSPGETVVIDSFENSHIHEVSLKGRNKNFLQYQKESDELNGIFWKSNSNGFSQEEYIKRVDSFSNKWFTILTVYEKNNLNDSLRSKELENYLESDKLNKYAMPFFLKEIPSSSKDKLEQLYFNKFKKLKDSETIFPSMLISVNWFYTKQLMTSHNSFNEIINSQYFQLTKKKQKIISAEFLKSYAKNQLSLSAEELQKVNYYLCSERLNILDNYCDYYLSKTLYKNSLISEFAKTDSLADATGNYFSFPALFPDKNIHFYLWASWCIPCVKFMKTLNMEKIEKSDEIIFLSLDENYDSWLLRAKDLQLPIKNSFIIKHGKNSAFANYLQINSLPKLIDLNKNRVNMYNLSKSIFVNAYKEENND